MIHVAILLDPYLQAILDGRKTIEMRLTLTNRVPFEAIEAGERLYFKRSGGPFRGTALAEHVMFMRDLTPRDVARLRRDYNEWVCAEDATWTAKRTARFCTLIWLRHVEPVQFGPRMRPHHGVAWQCLPDKEDVYPRCVAPDDRLFTAGSARGAGAPLLVAVTDANIRHGHIYLSEVIDRFPPDALGGSTRADAGRPLRLEFSGGKTVDTDIVQTKKIFRSRAWRSWFVEQGAEPGDRVRLTPRGPRSFAVSLIRTRDRSSAR